MDNQTLIRATLSLGGLEALADVVVASGMPLDDVRRLVIEVTAAIDELPDSRAMPEMRSAALGWSADVSAAVEALLRHRLIEAIEHLEPRGAVN